MQSLAARVLSEQQARDIVALGPEAAVFVILELSKRLAEQQAKVAAESHQTPSTPSGIKPPYLKPPRKRRQRRPGGKPGHSGSRRQPPQRIDWQAEHRADRCPDCGGRLKRCQETRTRYIEDIPEVRPEVTEHTIHRDWCPRCRQRVEPPVPDALPGSSLGNRVLVLSAWLHYGLGNTLSQIVEVFNFHLQLKITSGGLMQMRYPAVWEDYLICRVCGCPAYGWKNPLCFPGTTTHLLLSTYLADIPDSGSMQERSKGTGTGTSRWSQSLPTGCYRPRFTIEPDVCSSW